VTSSSPSCPRGGASRPSPSLDLLLRQPELAWILICFSLPVLCPWPTLRCVRVDVESDPIAACAGDAGCRSGEWRATVPRGRSRRPAARMVIRRLVSSAVENTARLVGSWCSCDQCHHAQFQYRGKRRHVEERRLESPSTRPLDRGPMAPPVRSLLARPRPKFGPYRSPRIASGRDQDHSLIQDLMPRLDRDAAGAPRSSGSARHRDSNLAPCLHVRCWAR